LNHGIHGKMNLHYKWPSIIITPTDPPMPLS
jgi:hypothetical protein